MCPKIEKEEQKERLLEGGVGFSRKGQVTGSVKSPICTGPSHDTPQRTTLCHTVQYYTFEKEDSSFE